MQTKTSSINIYPACLDSDMRDWVNPSATLTATVTVGEIDEYGGDYSVVSIADHSGYEIYKETGDFNKDIEKLVTLVTALGHTELYARSMFETNNSYGFICKAFDPKF